MSHETTHKHCVEFLWLTWTHLWDLFYYVSYCAGLKTVLAIFCSSLISNEGSNFDDTFDVQKTQRRLWINFHRQQRQRLVAWLWQMTLIFLSHLWWWMQFICLTTFTKYQNTSIWAKLWTSFEKMFGEHKNNILT